MKTKILMVAAFLLCTLTSCLKDNTKWDYKFDSGFAVGATSRTCYVGQEYEIWPDRMDYTPYTGADTAKITFKWVLDTKEVLEGWSFIFRGTEVKTYSLYLFATDNETGITKYVYCPIKCIAKYGTGWMILYDEAGTSKLAHISRKLEIVNEKYEMVYYVYDDIYGPANDGEELGSQPVKIVEHYVNRSYGAFNTNSELLVIQRGGPGCVEIDANSMVKAIDTSKEFIGEVLPAGFAPIDAVYMPYVNFFLNSDGKVYFRAVGSPDNGFHQSLFIPNPVEIPGGMDVRSILHTHYYSSYFVLMYDALNKRLLIYGNRSANLSGNVGTLLLKSGKEYPQGFTDLNDFGDMDFVYGSSIKAPTYYGGYLDDFIMLLKDPDNRYWFHSFHVDLDTSTLGGEISFADGQGSREFENGNSIITDKTVFRQLRGRDYLFLTSGANNTDLYYYDERTFELKLYRTFDSPIVAMDGAGSGHGNTELGVVTENGGFSLWDVSDATFISGQPVLLFETGGFGKPVDVIRRYGNLSKHLQ